MSALDMLSALEEDGKDEPWFSEARDKDPKSEFDRQREFLSIMRRIAPAVMVFAIPNGSRDTDWSRLRKFQEGALAGMTDLGILWNHGAFFAEMKGGKTAISPKQRLVLNRLHRLGFRCGVYRQPMTLVRHLHAAGAPFLPGVEGRL